MVKASKSRRRDLPVLRFKTQIEWTRWLHRNGGSSRGVWLCLAKKNADKKSVTYSEALDAALCYGWIDGQKGTSDDGWWLQRFTPRGDRSIWSRQNRERAEALIKSRRMRAAGLKAVVAAKNAGQWDRAYESQRSMNVPSDLRKALAKNPSAHEFFKTLNSVNRYAILFRIHTAKKEETRKQRIERYVAMLNKGETIHPQRRARR